MPFLHFTSDCHEWGFEVPDGFIPAVGDTVMLWYALPDEPEDDSEESVNAIVTNREWPFASDWQDDMAVYLDVKLEEEIPDGYIPTSDAWPASKHTQRKRQLQIDLERIRSGRPLGEPNPTAQQLMESFEKQFIDARFDQLPAT